jgi:hypothetical protein
MTPEQQAKLINETNYGKAGSLTHLIVIEITKKFAHRAPEFLVKPMHEIVDIVFEEFQQQLMQASGKFDKPEEAFEYLIDIASRWGTEHVMQSIEMTRQMKAHMESLQNKTNTGTNNESILD